MRLLLALLLLAPAAYADGPYTRSRTAAPTTSGGGGTTSPGGSSGQVQYNNGGAFGGVSGLTTDGANNLYGVNISATGTVSASTVSATAVNATNVSGTNVAGTLSTAAQPNITSIGTLVNISATNGTFTNVSGTLTTAAQANVTSVGTLTGLTVNGAISATSIAVTNTLGFISATIGNFTTISATASYIVSPMFGGPVVSTSAAFTFKQTASGSSINGLNIESPAGIAMNLFADSSAVSMRRNGGAAGGAIQITNTGLGIGGASTLNASLTVAGTISGSGTFTPSSDAGTCNTANTGTIRYSTVSASVQFCNGTKFVSLVSGT